MVKLHFDEDEIRLKAKGGKGANFVVCHVSKFKNSDVVGMYKHIQREMKTTLNEDIEFDKTALNYDLSGFDKKTMNYSDEVKKRLDERFRGQKSIRKDATVMVGVIISASPGFFENMPDEQERKYFQQAFDYLSDKFGRENIISATVHKDEKTPHMHLNFVPLTKDGRLSAKEIINRETLLDLQENLPKSLQEMGFDISRGLPSRETRVKHENPRDWKIRTAKNELERTKHITARAKRIADERERITVKTEPGIVKQKSIFDVEQDSNGLQDGQVLSARSVRSRIANRNAIADDNSIHKKFTEHLKNRAEKPKTKKKSKGMKI